MDNEYKRISCDLYDKLEAWSVLGKQVNVTYDENGKTISRNILIKTLQTKNKAEFLIAEDGLVLRLDRIKNIKIS